MAARASTERNRRGVNRVRRGLGTAAVLALLGGGLIGACGSSEEPNGNSADAQPFWDVAPGPGGGAAAIASEWYESLRSMTSAADLVVRARPGAVRPGPSLDPDPSRVDGDLYEGLLVSAIVELEPIEILAGDPPTGPIDLKLTLGFDKEIDFAEEIRELENAEPEEGIYFLRSGTVLAEISQNPVDDEVARGNYTVQPSAGLVVDRGGEAVFPGLESYEEEAARDSVAADLAGEVYADVLEAVTAEADWRRRNPAAAEAERERMLERFYVAPVT